MLNERIDAGADFVTVNNRRECASRPMTFSVYICKFSLINRQSLPYCRQHFFIRGKPDPAFLRHLLLAYPNRKLTPIAFHELGFNA